MASLFVVNFLHCSKISEIVATLKIDISNCGVNAIESIQIYSQHDDKKLECNKVKETDARKRMRCVHVISHR